MISNIAIASERSERSNLFFSNCFAALLLAMTIMLAMPRTAAALKPAEAPPPFTIRNVEYESFDGSGKLAIQTNEEIEYVVYELEDPHRIVIDPLDAVWCDFEEAVYFPEGVVRSIKFIKSRDLPDGPGAPYYSFDFVTVELSEPLPYDFSENEYEAVLNIGESKAPETAGPAVLEKARVVEGELIAEFATREKELREQERRIRQTEESLLSEKEDLARREEKLRLAEQKVLRERRALREKAEAGEEAGQAFSESRTDLELAREELAREKAGISAAKDEFFKKNVALERQKAALDKEREELARAKEELERERENIRKRMKFEPRPQRRLSGDDPPPEYSGRTLTLKDCVDIAMSNSMAVKVAKEKVKLTKMKVNESFRELFPEFALMWDETKGTISDAFYVGRKFGLEFKQVITHGGEQISLWEQSKVNLKVAKETLNKEKEELIFEVSKAYYEAVKAARKHTYQKELLEDIRGDFGMVKKEREYELISPIDYMNVESLVGRIEHSTLISENSAALAVMELNKVMNIDIDADIAIDLDLPEDEVTIDRERCISLALQFKPEYRISYLNTEVAKLSERIADAQTFPQIDIFGKYLKAAERLEPLNIEPLRHFLDNEKSVGATVTVPWGPHTFSYQKKEVKFAPTVSTFESDTTYNTDKFRLDLFDEMGRYTEIKDASVKYKEALEEFNAAEQDIYTEINQSLFSLRESAIKTRNSRSDIMLYEKEVEVAHVRKGLDDISFYELIEAKSKLYNERGAYAEALADYHTAIARINRAIGVGGYFQ